MTLYSLPHKFTIDYVKDDPNTSGGFMLMCNGNFVKWSETIDEIFIAYGNQLKHAKG